MEEILQVVAHHHHHRPIKRAKLDATQPPKNTVDGGCALQPLIRQLNATPPTDYGEMATILRTIQSSTAGAMMILQYHHQNDNSWRTLQRVLTLRLGYMAGSLPPTTTTTTTWSSNFGTVLSLAIQCLQSCQERTSIRPRTEDHHDETIETLRTVLGILEQLVGSSSSSSSSSSSNTNDQDLLLPLRVEEICRNCIDLFSVWLDDSDDHGDDNNNNNNNNKSKVMLIVDRSSSSSFLEEMALVLVKAATVLSLDNHHQSAANSSSSSSSNETANRIMDFFQRHSLRLPRRAGGRTTTSVFHIAVQVLKDVDDDDDDDVGDDDSKVLSSEEPIVGQRPHQQDQLFLIQCLALVRHRRPSPQHIERLIRLIQEDTTSSTSKNEDPVDASATTAKAMNIIQQCAQHLTVDQISETSRAIRYFAIHLQEELDESSSSTTISNRLLPALHCLETLLPLHPPTDCFWSTWEDILEVCSTLALEMSSSSQHHTVQAGATSLLLVLLSMTSAHQVRATDNQKRRILGTLSRILALPQSSNVLSRAVQLTCEWVDCEVLRREILELHPDLLVSLAQAVTTYRVSEEDKSKIVNAFWTILKKESKNNFLARQSKILESVVSMASMRSPVPESSSTTEATRWVAMSVLLTLSENPCNRRILANHPCLLSSMIHFVRQFPNNSDPAATNHHHRHNETCAIKQQGDMKRQILLLANAL